MALLQEVLPATVPLVRELIAKCRTTEDSQMESTLAALKQLLVDNRVAAVVRLDHQLVLVCPSNRFNLGLDVSDVHSILDDVCSVGWDWEEGGIPICF